MLRFDNVDMALVLPEQHPAHIAVVSDNAAQYGALNLHRDGTASTYTQDPWGQHHRSHADSGHPHK